MGNIFKDFNVGLRYDLKGSSQGRTFLKQGQKPKDNKQLKTALKDNDFTKHVKSIEFALTNDQLDESQLLITKKSTLIQILKDDADFLAKCSIIDYSLLLGEIEDPADELRERIQEESD